MKKVKLLWAIAVGLFYVSVLSFVSAILVDITGVYSSYKLPSCMPSNILMSIIWATIYLCFSITLSQFIIEPKLSVVVCYLLIALFNILYIILFFHLGSLPVCLIICICQLLLIIYLLMMGLKQNLISSYTFIFVFSWYLYLAILTYIVLINN